MKRFSQESKDLDEQRRNFEHDIREAEDLAARFTEWNSLEQPSLQRHVETGPLEHDNLQPISFRGLDVMNSHDLLTPHDHIPHLAPYKALDVGHSWQNSFFPAKEQTFFSKDQHKDEFRFDHNHVQYDVHLDNSIDTFHASENLQPPLAMGGYLEPYYHFFSRSEPSTIMRQLEFTLMDLRQMGHTIDFEVKSAHKFKIKCDYYSRCSRIPFVIRVFRLENQSGRYAIEFQRRSGDAMAFCALYRLFHDALKKSNVAEEIEEENDFADSSWGVNDTALHACDANQFDPSQAAQSVQYLLEMISSNFVDVQSQAVHVIALMSQESAMHSALLQLGVFEALLKLVPSSCEEVHRCALTALAELSCSVHAKTNLLDLVANKSDMKPIVYTTGSKRPQIVREAARLLLNIVQKVGSFDGCDEVAIAANRNLGLNSDAVARDYGEQILSCLGPQTA